MVKRRFILVRAPTGLNWRETNFFQVKWCEEQKITICTCDVWLILAFRNHLDSPNEVLQYLENFEQLIFNFKKIGLVL